MKKIFNYLTNLFSEQGKLKHFIVGMLIFLFLSIAMSLTAALILTILVGAVKEVVDNKFDWNDLAATSIGAFTVFVIELLKYLNGDLIVL